MEDEVVESRLDAGSPLRSVSRSDGSCVLPKLFVEAKTNLGQALHHQQNRAGAAPSIPGAWARPFGRHKHFDLTAYTSPKELVNENWAAV